MIGQPAADRPGHEALISQSPQPGAWSADHRKVNGTFTASARRRVSGLLSWPKQTWIDALGRFARKKAARQTPPDSGQVLEVKVGSGPSLPAYPHDVHVTGVDSDARRLESARARVAARALDNVQGLHRMAAEALGFAAESFDRVTAYRSVFECENARQRAHVLGEFSRVLRPGGNLLLIERANRLPAATLPATQETSAAAKSTPAWISDYGFEFLRRWKLDPLGLFIALQYRKGPVASAA